MVVKLDQDVKPSVQLRKLYYMYLFAGMAIFVLLFVVPFLAFGTYDALFVVAIFPGIPVLTGFIIALVWIPMYFNTIAYKFSHSEMGWKRGVWFRKTGVVPYNRITNVDVEQGPVSRKLGIASIKVQTAGYSSPNARTSEIRIEGMTNFDEVRDVIMTYVRGQRPMAVETYDKDDDANVIGELVKIRKLLEKRGRKG